ncbi:hypothetical protein GQE99_00170 [Maritimibacter sp. DP07]|uniref:Uncharacterized protein n=1 Tax=Maritimibacter harenae TaxID=2606218 RepID=A0A845LVR0_9RHOB|nr:hypothetical protein [Maritimibacter harenae]MZR11446.1 hypothetical protein [Maritimibacter harenae]
MTNGEQHAARLADTLQVVAARLAEARPFAKARHQSAALDVIGRLAAQPDGLEYLFDQATRLDKAGLFAGSDWDMPETLLPQLTGQTLASADRALVALEAASLLRLLAVATGQATHRNLHADAARHFLAQVLAHNLRYFFATVSEADREQDPTGLRPRIFSFIVERIGFGDVLGTLVEEIWRILEQRPVQVGPVKEMIMQISLAMSAREIETGQERLGADRLVSALFGPTASCMDDPGLDVFLDRIAHLDDSGLQREALGFSRAMHDTGLVSAYHAEFLRWIAKRTESDFMPDTLGLGPTGIDSLRRWRGLVGELIEVGVTAHTPQAVYGLALLLERGILHSPPIAPALQRQLRTRPTAEVAERLRLAFGDMVEPERLLLAGTLNVLGQPLGLGQGANPTCQSARAIAMWSFNDPDYVLHLIRQVAEVDSIMMHFEGQPIHSADLPAGLALGAPIDADPVSVALVPHLDRIYAEMGRRCIGREGDPHRWVNPEFHGWWVARDCVVAVDVASGMLSDYDAFITRFHQGYHPEYNGGRPVIHPQPAGIAVTDSSARFVGWHAIAILRVDVDQHGVHRVYFFNPNNDSGQDWGGDVIVSTSGHGERHGEGSLPLDQFVSRLYLFHDDPLTAELHVEVPEAVLRRIEDMALASWASGRKVEGARSMVGLADPEA